MRLLKGSIMYLIDAQQVRGPEKLIETVLDSIIGVNFPTK